MALVDPVTTDYVLVTGAYIHMGLGSTRQVIHFDPPRHIHGNIWIGEIDRALSEAILEACEPRGENFKPVRQLACSYGFYRENAPAANPYGFDPDNALFTCIALSRIIHPTSVGYDTAARIRQWVSGRREIIPAGRTVLSANAYVIEPHDNWLIPNDLPPLQDLLQVFHGGLLPRRVHSALWHHEALSREFYIDIRWPLLTTCLEALVRIRNEKLSNGRFAGSLKVFVDRLLRIGQTDATLAVSENDLRVMYEQRSLLAHGIGFGALGLAEKMLYAAQERLVRGIIRKACLEPAFRNIFASDSNLATHLPLR